MEASRSRIDAGKVFGEALNTYGGQFGPLIGGAALVVGVTSVISNLLALSGGLFLFLGGVVIALIGQVIYTGYVVKLVQDVRDGRRDQSISELFEAAAPYVGTLILNGILYAIGVGIGIGLFIVPGLILVTIWAVVAPAIVVEDQGVFEAFGRSRELVRGNGWRVFLVVVVTFFSVIVLGQAFGAVGASLGDGGRVVAGTVAAVLLVPFEALVASILFFDLGGGAAAVATVEPPEAPAA